MKGKINRLNEEKLCNFTHDVRLTLHGDMHEEITTDICLLN